MDRDKIKVFAKSYINSLPNLVGPLEFYNVECYNLIKTNMENELNLKQLVCNMILLPFYGKGLFNNKIKLQSYFQFSAGPIEKQQIIVKTYDLDLSIFIDVGRIQSLNLKGFEQQKAEYGDDTIFYISYSIIYNRQQVIKKYKILAGSSILEAKNFQLNLTSDDNKFLLKINSDNTIVNLNFGNNYFYLDNKLKKMELFLENNTNLKSSNYFLKCDNKNKDIYLISPKSNLVKTWHTIFEQPRESPFLQKKINIYLPMFSERLESILEKDILVSPGDSFKINYQGKELINAFINISETIFLDNTEYPLRLTLSSNQNQYLLDCKPYIDPLIGNFHFDYTGLKHWLSICDVYQNNSLIGIGYINCLFFQTENDIYYTIIKNSGIELSNINIIKNPYKTRNNKFRVSFLFFSCIILTLLLTTQMINIVINQLENYNNSNKKSL